MTMNLQWLVIEPYEEHQHGLPSMVYNFFGKRSRATDNHFRKIILDDYHWLAYKLQKVITRKIMKQKKYSFGDNVDGTNLENKQYISK